MKKSTSRRNFCGYWLVYIIIPLFVFVMQYQRYWVRSLGWAPTFLSLSVYFFFLFFPLTSLSFSFFLFFSSLVLWILCAPKEFISTVGIHQLVWILKQDIDKGGEQTCQAEGETERKRALFISTQRAFEGGFNGDAAEIYH